MSEIIPLIDALNSDFHTAGEYLSVARLQLEQPATEAGRIASLNAVNSASNSLREAVNRLQSLLNQTMTLIQEVSDGIEHTRSDNNDAEAPEGSPAGTS